MTRREMLEPEPNKFYEFDGPQDVVKCGECWSRDIYYTRRNELVGDERVLPADLRELDSNEAWQCDDCLKQSDNYDDEVLGDN